MTPSPHISAALKVIAKRALIAAYCHHLIPARAVRVAFFLLPLRAA